jgi:small subunit ribosomal protein S6e
MWINIAYPRNGTIVPVQVDDDTIRRTNLFDFRLGQEVDGTIFGKQFKGYIFRLKGGSDKQGFPMVQGVMAASRVSLLLPRGAPGFNTFRGRPGERRRKAIRGCIVGPDIAMLNVVVVKTGDAEIEGLTNVSNPRRLGPKRANKIRKLFNLTRDDDVKRFVVRRKIEKANGKTKVKAPKVQRLITPVIKARRLKKIKSRQAALRKAQEQHKEYLHELTRGRRIHRQRVSALHRRKRVQQNIKDLVAMKKATGTTATKVAAKKGKA